MTKLSKSEIVLLKEYSEGSNYSKIAEKYETDRGTVKKNNSISFI